MSILHTKFMLMQGLSLVLPNKIQSCITKLSIVLSMINLLIVGLIMMASILRWERTFIERMTDSLYQHHIGMKMRWLEDNRIILPKIHFPPSKTSLSISTLSLLTWKILLQLAAHFLTCICSTSTFLVMIHPLPCFLVLQSDTWDHRLYVTFLPHRQAKLLLQKFQRSESPLSLAMI